MSTRYSECCEKVSKLMDILEEMTQWENDFVLDMAEIEEAGGLFTPNQTEKIEEIFARYERLL